MWYVVDVIMGAMTMTSLDDHAMGQKLRSHLQSFSCEMTCTKMRVLLVLWCMGYFVQSSSLYLALQRVAKNVMQDAIDYAR